MIMLIGGALVTIGGGLQLASALQLLRWPSLPLLLATTD